MLSRFFPGLLWLQGYRRGDLHADLLSGITVAFVLIPQGMAYATVAGLPPEYGLYACILPPLIYALLGTSNKISIGPVALDSILILTGLSLLAEPGSERYLQLAIVLTLYVGVIQVLFGVLKLGFIANFLSYPVILGYTSGAALVIMASQLESLVGMQIDSRGVPSLIYQLLLGIREWHWVTAGIGAGGIVFMIYIKRWLPKVPCALVLIIFGMLGAGISNLPALGVDVIDHIPRGLPTPSLPGVSLQDVLDLTTLAFTVALMGYIGSMSICKSLEKPTDKISAKPNQELLAVGFANIAGSLLRAFPVSASFSRSAAFRESGARTQVSAIASSVFILLTVLFLTPFFTSYPLPKTLLSAIIIVSVFGLVQVSKMRAVYAESTREFAVLILTFLVTLVVGIQQGLILGILLSVFMVIYNTARPHIAELGIIDEGASLYRNVNRFSRAQVREDVLIFRYDAPLYFANKDYFVERLYAWIKQRGPNKLRYIVFDMEAVNSIDYSAILMLDQVIENLRAQKIRLIVTNPIGPVRDVFKHSVLAEYMTEEAMFATISDAIVYIDQGVNVHAQASLQTNT